MANVTSISQRLKQAQQILSTHVAALSDAARRRPRLVLGVAAVLLLVGGAGGLLAVYGHEPFFERAGEIIRPQPLTLAELKLKAKQEPKNAAIQRDLGHAYFTSGSRSTALKAYAKALELDASVADDDLVENLVDSFGRAERRNAAALIGRYKLMDAQDRLLGLTRSKSYSVRWEAVRTLDKLGKSRRVDLSAVYELDLSSTDCGVRRQAVEKLGSIGSKRSLAAIRSAAERDEEETPWYRSSCLGKLPAEAEGKIAARK